MDVFKLDQDNDIVIECAHLLVPPANALVFATGGVIIEQVAAICAGQFAVGGDTIPNDRCMILHDQDSDMSGFLSISLNMFRMGAASLVIDDGRTIWITGGFSSSNSAGDVMSDQSVITTEFVSFETSNFSTNGMGPLLPVPLAHHCLERITPKVAILVGGQSTDTDIEDGTLIDCNV